MSDKRILITGSSSGFGDLIARTQAENGDRVYATMRGVNGKNEDKAATLRAWAEAGGHTLKVIDLDVTDEASVADAVDSIIDDAGGIDVVVNNAGVGGAGLMETFTPEQMQQLFNVNLFGVHRVNRAVLPTMRKQGSGLLVHISSLVGRLTMPFLGAYCPSKFGLEAYAESLANEVKSIGVESVTVEPGGYATDFFANLQQPADTERVESYGAVVKGMDEMFESMGASIQEMPSPTLVSDAVRDVIAMPAGQRPLRTAVDMMVGDKVNAMNASIAAVQVEFLAAYGIE